MNKELEKIRCDFIEQIKHMDSVLGAWTGFRHLQNQKSSTNRITTAFFMSNL